MKKLAKIYLGLIYLLPAVLFFSYYPIIKLGNSETMNFELSLPLIWLVLFDIISLIIFSLNFKKQKMYELVKKRSFVLPIFFPLFASLSILWSSNQLRGFLSVGVLWALFFAIFFIISLPKKIPELQLANSKLLKAIFIPSILVSTWCWVQTIADIFGAPREKTLMCPGCSISGLYKLPHPNGFTMEPQFMGNLLLVPLLIASYEWIKNRNSKQSKQYLIIIFWLFATLILTISRGAIYAFAIASIFLLIMTIIKTHTARPLILIPVMLVSFVFTLGAQGLMMEFSPDNNFSFMNGVANTVKQLSLGIIDLTPKREENVLQESQTSQNLPVAPQDIIVSSESANIRINLTKQAIDVWLSNPRNFLIGVGYGGAGVSLYEKGHQGSPKEIVQNEFFSLLVETGIVGIIIVIMVLVMIIKILAKTYNATLFYAIFIAFGVSLMFFSGLPNALHIYLLPALIKHTKDQDELSL